MADIRVGVIGCGGRMGRMVLSELAATKGCRIAGGTEPKGSALLGRDLGEIAGTGPLGVAVTDKAETLFAGADVVIDFTTPAASVLHAGMAARTGTAFVLGTTGLDDKQLAAVTRAARKAPVVRAANMSLGVTLLAALVEKVAAALGPDYDIEIVEMHHRHKVDAPSGTALALGEAAAAGRGVRLAKVARRGRDGYTGPRRTGDIGFAALRGGDVVGDHSVVFAGAGERIELVHRASSRQIFARGAVRAALWVADRKSGLYSMRDVLGFS